MMYARHILAVVMGLWSALAYGQQEWMYSQYMFNLFDVNAAYAGNHGSPSFALRQRAQWIGLDGAPQSQLISAHLPSPQQRLGYGLRLQHESIGARSQVSARMSVAYKLPMKSSKLAFALSGGWYQQRFEAGKLTAADANDQLVQDQNWQVNQISFDASVLWSGDRFYTGIEVSRLNRDIYYTDKNSLARMYMHLHWVGGYLWKIRNEDMLHSSVLVRSVEGRQIQPEAHVAYLWKNKWWLGAGYRWNYGPVGQVHFNINSQWRIGYSFDTALQWRGTSSHEVFLGYNLTRGSQPSIRYFQ
jgi:type IX secretion system PorP/SprF family membrane protein